MNKSRKAFIGGKPKYVTLFRNWGHQGYFYLDKTERFHRTTWELIPVIFLCYTFKMVIDLNLFYSIFLSFIIVHTYNWIVNNNFWAVVIHSMPKQKNPGENLTIEYLLTMQNRLEKSSAISGVLIYGSIARNKWHDRSDIDIRFLRKKGILNGFLSYLILRRERFIALILGQPLDSYLADSELFLQKMRKDEFPILIKNSDIRLIKEYNTDAITNFSSVNNLNKIS